VVAPLLVADVPEAGAAGAPNEGVVVVATLGAPKLNLNAGRLSPSLALGAGVVVVFPNAEGAPLPLPEVFDATPNALLPLAALPNALLPLEVLPNVMLLDAPFPNVEEPKVEGALPNPVEPNPLPNVDFAGAAGWLVAGADESAAPNNELVGAAGVVPKPDAPAGEDAPTADPLAGVVAGAVAELPPKENTGAGFTAGAGTG